MPKKDDIENLMEKTYAPKEKICELQDNAQKAIAIIEKRCTDKVQNDSFWLRPQGNETLGISGST